jgi:Fe-S cluster biogenesis protein NfuA
MELVGVDGGVVTLKLMGSCHGCPSSSVTLTQGVEKILRDNWPEFRELRVEGAIEHRHEGPALIQIQSLKKRT